LEANAAPEVMVQCLRDCYWAAVNEAESAKGGTTFTAALLGKESLLFASIQVGDSMSGVCDPVSKLLIETEEVHYCDDAGGYDKAFRDPSTGKPAVLTRLHSFNDKAEVERWRRTLAKDGMSLNVNERDDCHPLEDRFLADVQEGGKAPVHLPEPSRAVEAREAFAEHYHVIHTLQRSPEFAVWQLPADRELVVFAVCDGFMSKLALPTEQRFVEALCDPGVYFMADKYDGTVFEDCEVVDLDSPEWGGLDVTRRLKFIREECELPDDEWQDAHTHSVNSLIEIASNNNGALPPLRDNAQAAVEAVAHIAVMLLSDDNITATIAHMKSV